MKTYATENPTLAKIAALLRQAESTDNEAEAKVYTEKAQELASLYQIDLALARDFVPVHERKETPTTKTIILGERGKKGLDQYVELFDAIARANDVKLNVFHDSTGVIVFGFPSDIEVVETLYASLVVQMVDQANAYLATGKHKEELVWREKRTKDDWGYVTTEWGQFPLDGRQARRSFQTGFTAEISARLQAARRKAVQETEEAKIAEVKALGGEVNPYKDPESDVYDPHSDEAKQWDKDHSQDHSVALVLVRKEEEVSRFYNEKSRARGHWRGSSARSHGGGSYGAGRSAGKSARLSTTKGLKGRGSLGRGS